MTKTQFIRSLSKITGDIELLQMKSQQVGSLPMHRLVRLRDLLGKTKDAALQAFKEAESLETGP